MTSPGRLSVVVPTHDTRDLTLRCIETLVAEGMDGVEIVAVDDGSSDGTAEALAAAHPRVRVVRRSPAVGFTRAANLGLAEAGGDILLLLNSDTEVAPGSFAPLLAAFARDPRLGAAGAALHYPDGSPQWSGGGAPTVLWLFGLASGLPPLLARLPFWRRVKPVGAPAGEVDWVTGAALALRRQAWEESGGFDEGFRFYGQDLDLCLRLRDTGWKVEILPELRVLHHHGATIGSRSNVELLWTDLLRWARKSRGAGFARRAALALRTGAALRRLGRAAATPFVPDERRAAWRAESEALRRAISALNQE
ncbi:MAG TPA: glycosyltransferase family 2 protein [Thermoanaerobaculia bacterium]|nr:glycosyltransferase family 2 protein [Thermoanaerobaculia bacterium]